MGEQNLLQRAHHLVGDRDPRQHEFTLQLRAFDVSRSGASLGLPVLLSLCGALLSKSLKGSLGGTLDPVYNAVSVAELAIEKGAQTLLIPTAVRRQLNDLSDDMATKIAILYYADAREALLKALGECDPFFLLKIKPSPDSRKELSNDVLISTASGYDHRR